MFAAPRILVVGNDPVLAGAQATYLQEGFPGASVRLFTNVEEAWTALAAEGADVVLVDVSSAGVAIDELVQRIRGEETLPGAAVVLLVGEGSEQNLVSLLESTVDDFLWKPPRREELLVRVQVALARRGHQAQLAARARELEENYARASEFLSWVSHEIRTPLAALMSAAHVLKRYGSKRPEEVARFAEIIYREGQRLTRLVNNLLDLAKIEAGKVDWNVELVSLNDVMANVQEVFEALCTDRSLRLELPSCCEIRVRADRDKLSQVLTNLLSNAIKHSPQGGTVRLSCVPSTASVHMAVEDQGPGVPSGMEETIFQRFSQLGLTDEKGGTGLGLPIARELITRMGGRIWVERSTLGGARFVIELPYEGAGESLPYGPV